MSQHPRLTDKKVWTLHLWFHRHASRIIKEHICLGTIPLFPARQVFFSGSVYQTLWIFSSIQCCGQWWLIVTSLLWECALKSSNNLNPSISDSAFNRNSSGTSIVASLNGFSYAAHWLANCAYQCLTRGRDIKEKNQTTVHTLLVQRYNNRLLTIDRPQVESVGRTVERMTAQSITTTYTPTIKGQLKSRTRPPKLRNPSCSRACYLHGTRYQFLPNHTRHSHPQPTVLVDWVRCRVAGPKLKNQSYVSIKLLDQAEERTQISGQSSGSVMIPHSSSVVWG